jgi:PmbA protein
MSHFPNEVLAARCVELAKQLGATASECTITEGDEFSVTVRLGEIEKLTEAGSRAAGIRVLRGQKQGSAYTSDLSAEGLDTMVRQALELAALTTEDPFAGLPDPGDLGRVDADLQLYFEETVAFPAEQRIALARAAEKAALQSDPRIVNSEGATFGSGAGSRAFANSLGFLGSYRYSSCSFHVMPVARDGERMERDYWFTSARDIRKLDAPELVGQRAAERVLRRLGARKVATQKCPVIFEPRTARQFVNHVFEAVNGGAVYRKSSFLAGKLGETVAAPNLTIVDDSTIPGLWGTSPFDDEGVPSRRTVVLDRGVLASYLLNSYTARKLGLRTTGSASRGVSGNAGVGHGNFYLEPGSVPEPDLIRAVRSGLYVTELIGSGVNIVTGDYSRGAVGMWIENGELAYPVSEVTIASNLRDMLLGVEAVASDLEFQSSVAAPAVLLREMTVSGQ